MSIPSEPIGSIPRSPELLAALANADSRTWTEVLDRAVRDTIATLEAAGEQVVTDGEQAKIDAWTYPVYGADNLAPDSVVIPYADGHQRGLPRLTAGPIRYRTYADQYVRTAVKYAKVPVKQAVVAPSTLSLLYPPQGVDGYSRDAFVKDVLNEAEKEVRGCLEAGAQKVQLDFEEARLSLKLDPSGGLLKDFIDLNDQLLQRFAENERDRIGVHCGVGADQDSTHSLDVDCAELLPQLFRLQVGNYYLPLACEPDPDRVLGLIAEQLRPGIRVFVGVTDPIDPQVETVEQVRDRVLSAARHIPLDQLGTCDDAGFSPYADDPSTSRALAFAKIRARVEGTAQAAQLLT
ncbi:5-methyltetrahydropteroyltriglutamate--homocysteine methyltransferase [Embleya sp. AB8]|uniref:5-methyltetrahydropteroyltriglutamate-- homocysteine methyltransferase n=1 Tax=Embleya sp. AB8 TaxID=3156304 RepID=UPI003C7966B6